MTMFEPVLLILLRYPVSAGVSGNDSEIFFNAKERFRRV